jgi:poly(3-hydroxybutyrate) depolymerase
MAQAGPDGRSPTAWADLVRHAAPAGYTGAWPRLSIWHGGLDTVVDPANARLLATQWRSLHGLQAAPATVTEHGLARQESWGGATRPAVELWTLPAMGHGYPVATGGPLRSAAVLQAGVSATDRIAAFWHLT